jgi:hypothetical protein
MLMRWSSLTGAVLCAGLFTLASCTPLSQPTEPENLVSLETIPAEWGELVTVLHYPETRSTIRWDELWFENEETGTITLVPVYRWKWGYNPDGVRTITRTGTMAAPAGGE